MSSYEGYLSLLRFDNYLDGVFCLSDKLKTFAKTLGLSTPELNSNQSRQRPPNRALQGTRDEGARP